MSQDVQRQPGLKSVGYEIFIAAISVLSIVNLFLLYLVRVEALSAVLLVMNGLLSIVLFLDFLNRFFTAASKSDYFFRQYGWADLLASLPVEQVKVFRLFRLFKVYRLLRQYGARNIARSLVRDRAGSALYLLLLIGILVLQFGSLWMLRLEASAPNANITTASDALWYVIVTMSTVGYGDQYPVTNAGRLLGSAIIIVGVGIFGTLTGFLANVFVGGHSDEKQPAAEPGAEVEAAPTAGAAGAGPVEAESAAAGAGAQTAPASAATSASAGALDVADVREHVQRLRALAAEQQAQIEQLELQLLER